MKQVLYMYVSSNCYKIARVTFRDLQGRTSLLSEFRTTQSITLPYTTERAY